MNVHWIRALVAAVVFEIVLVVITIIITQFMPIETFLPFVAPTVFVVGLPFGMWSAAKMQSRFVLQGTLVGVIATAIYLALILGQFGSIQPVVEMYGPVQFFLANALKILGCVAGAYVAGRRRLIANAASSVPRS